MPRVARHEHSLTRALRGIACGALLCGMLTGGRAAPGAASAGERDAQHDFDFEIGSWQTHLSRLEHPLSGSHTWVEYDGTTEVRKVWNGRANLVELEVDGPAGHIEALSLRLYNPQSREWSLNFASSRGGTLGVPTVGGFKDGRGEFSIRNSSATAACWCALSSRFSARTPAISSRRFPPMAGAPGRPTGSRPTHASQARHAASGQLARLQRARSHTLQISPNTRAKLPPTTFSVTRAGYPCLSSWSAMISIRRGTFRPST